MSHSADADEFILAEWRAALSDASVLESDFHLITCPGAPTPDRPKAVSFERHHVVTTSEDDGEIIATQTKLDEAAHHAAVNRVATFEDWDEDDPVELARLAGLLRHEIEHGRQRDACQNAFGLYDLTDAVIRHAVQDGRNHRELFHLQPVEWDADAAASMYLRAHPDHRRRCPICSTDKTPTSFARSSRPATPTPLSPAPSGFSTAFARPALSKSSSRR